MPLVCLCAESCLQSRSFYHLQLHYGTHTSNCFYIMHIVQTCRCHAQISWELCADGCARAAGDAAGNLVHPDSGDPL